MKRLKTLVQIPYPIALETLWFVASLWFFFTQNADFFKRMGALGVAVFVVTYGFALYNVTSLNRKIAEATQRQNLGVIQSLNHRTHIALKLFQMEMKYFKEREFQEGPNWQAQLSAEDKHELREEYTTLKELLDTFFDKSSGLDIASEWKRLEEAVDEVKRIHERTTSISGVLTVQQIVFLVVATLQWGFGDLLVMWFWS